MAQNRSESDHSINATYIQHDYQPASQESTILAQKSGHRRTKIRGSNTKINRDQETNAIWVYAITWIQLFMSFVLFFFSETISGIYVASSGPKFRKPCTRANKIFGQHRADSKNKNLKRDQHTLPVTTNALYKIIWWIEQIAYLKNSWNPFSEKYLTTTGPQLTL